MSIKDAAQFYKSTSYADEITWAATWLYRATANSKWLRAVRWNLIRCKCAVAQVIIVYLQYYPIICFHKDYVFLKH